MTSSTTTSAAIISNDVAKQLGKEFTENYPATVLGIARKCIRLRPGFHVTGCKIKAVRSNGLEVSLTCCRGDLCELKNGFYNLDPPLESVEEWNGKNSDSTTGSKTGIKNRIEIVHQGVCRPDPTWLINDPAAATILVTCAGLTYGVWIGTDEMASMLSQHAPRLEHGIATIFGSIQNFGYAVHASFWFAILAHTFEAGIGTLYCRTLSLQTSSTVLWSFMIFLVGFPILKELQALVKAQEPPAVSKKSH
jgi:Domain of unknown function (DUF4499)